MRHDPTVIVVDRIEHDPGLAAERLEAEGYAVSRQDDGGYRVTGAIDDEDNAIVLLPDDQALHWWSHAWLLRGFHERDRACYRGYTAFARRPASPRRRSRARFDNPAQLSLFE